MKHTKLSFETTREILLQCLASTPRQKTLDQLRISSKAQHRVIRKFRAKIRESDALRKTLLNYTSFPREENFLMTQGIYELLKKPNEDLVTALWHCAYNCPAKIDMRRLRPDAIAEIYKNEIDEPLGISDEELILEIEENQKRLAKGERRHGGIYRLNCTMCPMDTLSVPVIIDDRFWSLFDIYSLDYRIRKKSFLSHFDLVAARTNVGYLTSIMKNFDGEDASEVEQSRKNEEYLRGYQPDQKAPLMKLVTNILINSPL